MENVPEIRFRGFAGEWELRKLSDMKDVRDGTHDSPEYFQEGHPLVTSKNLTESGLDMTDVSLISNKDFEAINKRSKVDTGDIIFGMIGTIGNPVIVDREDFAIKNVALIKDGKQAPNSFLLQLLKSPAFKKYIRLENAGNTQKFLGLGKIRDYMPYIPIAEEMETIGAFFRTLDTTIILYKRKLDGLKRLKSACFQQMFPQVGEAVPQLRFATFNGDWQVRKLGDFSSKSGKKNRYDKDYPAYSVSNLLGLIPQSEQFEDSRLDDLDKAAYKIVEPNEFAYNPARINVGSIAFNDLDKRVIISSLYVIVKMDSQIDNEFILQYIKSPEFTKEVRRNTEGSVREYLFYENFSNILFPFAPIVEEQTAIGNFFRNLDNAINTQAEKLEQVKRLKSAYLQKMFV